jgi:hypothetical protein
MELLLFFVLSRVSIHFVVKPFSNNCLTQQNTQHDT